MSESKEIQKINDLIQRGRTIAFDDFEGLKRLQADHDLAIEQGLIDESVSMKLLLVMLERVQAGEADEVAERVYGIKVDRGTGK